jgi:uncharacterized membrane protein
MNWILKGMLAALWQVVGFILLLVLFAAGMWSFAYLGLDPGYGIISFYIGTIIVVNLYFSYISNRSSLNSEKQ